MPEPLKVITAQEVSEAVDALRKEILKGNPSQEKLDKINETLDLQEAHNQELVKSQEASKKSAEEQAERLNVLELELARVGGPGNGKDYKLSEEYKALKQFCIQDEDLTREQKAILRTDSDVQGGTLVMSEMDNVIVKTITETDALRSLARVRTISSKTLEMPQRATNMVATYEGEAEDGDESNQTYKSETVTAYRQTVTIPITQDMLMDAAFDMESEIMVDAAEAFALGEGNGFIAGTGNKQPEGIITNATLQGSERETAASGIIRASDMILLTGDLKVGYNPSYIMNRKTLAQLRTLRADAVSGGDSAGNFLWQPGLNGPVSNQINGFSYALMPSMQDIAASSYSVAFGDWRRGYVIIDRTGTSVVRDNVTRKKAAIIEFTIHRWNTGRVVLPEAIKLLKTKA